MVNLLSVLVAAIASFIIGWLWYSNFMFEKTWMGLMQVKKTDMKGMKDKMMKSMVFGFLSTLVAAFVLAVLIELTNSTTAMVGAQLGILVWLGFIATTSLGAVLWESRPLKLYLLNNLHSLLVYAVMGAIIAIM